MLLPPSKGVLFFLTGCGNKRKDMNERQQDTERYPFGISFSQAVMKKHGGEIKGKGGNLTIVQW